VTSEVHPGETWIPGNMSIGAMIEVRRVGGKYKSSPGLHMSE
jgi:hypothetical protein